MSSKLISYNLNLGRNFLKRKDCLDKMFKALKMIEWDYLCLQEIPRQWMDSKEIEEILKDNYFVFHSISENGLSGTQYNGIISKNPIIKSGHYDLSVLVKEPRGLSWILGQDPNHQNKITKVGCLHLGLSVIERRAQREKIIDFFSSFKETYDQALLCGDFNEWNFLVNPNPFNRVELSDAHKKLHKKLAKTYPSFFPLFPLDRIYVKNGNVDQCKILKGDPWKSLSDHLPISIDFI